MIIGEEGRRRKNVVSNEWGLTYRTENEVSPARK